MVPPCNFPKFPSPAYDGAYDDIPFWNGSFLIFISFYFHQKIFFYSGPKPKSDFFIFFLFTETKMEISVCGFLKYRQLHQFSIPLLTKTLYSANNGTGKTSLCQAIQWCLYGEPRDVANVEASETYVTISFSPSPPSPPSSVKEEGSPLKPGKEEGCPLKGKEEEKRLVICRQKKPERLRLVILSGDKVIDEAIDTDAQNRIYRRFGNAEIWKFSHYIDEARKNDFLALSGKDKAKILFAFISPNGVGAAGEIKEEDRIIAKIDLAIDQSSLDLASMKNMVTMMQNNYHSACNILRPTDTDLVMISKINDYELALKAKIEEREALQLQYQKWGENKRVRDNIEKNLSILRTKLNINVIEIPQFNINALIKEREEITEKVKSLTEDKRQLQIQHQLDEIKGKIPSSLLDKIPTKKELLEVKVLMKQYQDMQKAYTALKLEYTNEIKNMELNRIDNLLADSKIRQELLKEREKIVNLRQQLSKIPASVTESIDQVKHRIHEIRQGLKVLTTPCCNQSCVLVSDKLVAVSHAPHSTEDLRNAEKYLEIVLIKTQLSEKLVVAELACNELGKKVSISDAPPCDIEGLIQLRHKINSLHWVAPVPYLQQELDLMEEYFSLNLSVTGTGSRLSLEEIDLLIKEVNDRKKELDSLIPRVLEEQKLFAEYEIYQAQLRNLITLEAPTTDLAKVKEEEQAYFNYVNRLKGLIPLVQERDKIRVMEKEIMIREERMQKLLRLRHKAVELKINLLQGVVDQLNESLGKYTSKLFEEDSESVSLIFSLEKTLKSSTVKNKKIRVEVNHHFSVGGSRRPSVSKGMRDRISVALMLAFNDFSSPSSPSSVNEEGSPLKGKEEGSPLKTGKEEGSPHKTRKEEGSPHKTRKEEGSPLKGKEEGENKRFPIVILDDVLSSMDQRGEEKCLELIQTTSSGVLCTGHRLIHGGFDKILR
jgi:hypothetical protein